MPRSTTIAPARETLRYTRDGSPALEQHLAQLCHRITAGIRRIIPEQRLHSILLAGGYGRGEGGVLRTAGAPDSPYNDLEFYILVHGPRPLVSALYQRPLHQLAHQLTELTQQTTAPLEIEFKLLTPAQLQSAPASLHSYDLLSGHRLLHGSPESLAAFAHHLQPTAIPAHEVTRLLFNRTSGLLFSLERLQKTSFTAEDADFIERNLAKLQLALGDCVLAHHHRYHWSALEREQRLPQLTAAKHWLGTELFESILQQHPHGVRFKLRPHLSTATREELAQRHQQLSHMAQQLWLKLESQRLGQPFASPTDYALSPASKSPEQPLLKSLLIALRTFGPRTPHLFTYPREHLLRSLPLLLWTPWEKDPALLRSLQSHLHTPATTLPHLLQAYLPLWNRFN